MGAFPKKGTLDWLQEGSHVALSEAALFKMRNFRKGERFRDVASDSRIWEAMALKERTLLAQHTVPTVESSQGLLTQSAKEWVSTSGLQRV